MANVIEADYNQILPIEYFQPYVQEISFEDHNDKQKKLKLKKI